MEVPLSKRAYSKPASSVQSFAGGFGEARHARSPFRLAGFFAAAVLVASCDGSSTSSKKDASPDSGSDAAAGGAAGGGLGGSGIGGVSGGAGGGAGGAIGVGGASGGAGGSIGNPIGGAGGAIEGGGAGGSAGAPAGTGGQGGSVAATGGSATGGTAGRGTGGAGGVAGAVTGGRSGTGGQGGSGGTGTGGSAATGGRGGGGGGGRGGMGGAQANNGGIGGGLNCGNHVSVTTTVFTDFEYLTDSPFIEFTSPTGFRGVFFGDNDVNGSTFAVATGADAHSPGHALKVTTANTGFVEIGPNFAGRNGCLDLSAFKGISFWVKGNGRLHFKLTDGTADRPVGNLTTTYTQHTVTWTLAGFSPPVLMQTEAPPRNRSFLFYVDGPGDNSSASLYVDDIELVP